MTLIRNRVFKFEKLEPLIQKKENQLYVCFAIIKMTGTH